MKSEEVCKLVVDNKNTLLACGLAIWQSLETWLGKTTKVRAGSVPEAIYNGVKFLLAKEEPKMEKAYDLKDLVARLKSVGLEATEEGAKEAVKQVISFLKESATMSATPFDDLLVPLLATAEPKIMEKIEGINPNG